MSYRYPETYRSPSGYAPRPASRRCRSTTYNRAPSTHATSRGALNNGCSTCGGSFHDGMPFVIGKDGKKYHEECFRCCSCGGHMDHDQYKPTAEGPMCLTCALPSCHHCGDLIVGDVVAATTPDGTTLDFHTQCLSCINCGNHIVGKYKAGDGGFLCPDCSNPRCCNCGTLISGGGQYYLDKRSRQPICSPCHTGANRRPLTQFTTAGAATTFINNSPRAISVISNSGVHPRPYQTIIGAPPTQTYVTQAYPRNHVRVAPVLNNGALSVAPTTTTIIRGPAVAGYGAGTIIPTTYVGY